MTRESNRERNYTCSRRLRRASVTRASRRRRRARDTGTEISSLSPPTRFNENQNNRKILITRRTCIIITLLCYCCYALLPFTYCFFFFPTIFRRYYTTDMQILKTAKIANLYDGVLPSDARSQ